jgi:Phosphatidylglycerol lysyltransferase, C-terminal
MVETMLWAKAQGYRWFELGMAPLAGLPDHRLAPLWSKLGRFIYRHGASFYNLPVMARPRKDVRYDADAATIKRFFEQSWDAREEQKAASGLISSLNSEMEAAGVHSGALSMMRRIRAMPSGKRGFFLFLLRRYSDILEEELHDPAFAAQVEEKADPVPFVQAA